MHTRHVLFDFCFCFLASFEAKLRMEHTDHEQQLKDEEAMELGLEMLKDMVLKY